MQCDILVDSPGRCAACTQQRKSLYILSKRVSKVGDRTHPSSHAPYTSLTTPEKHKRLSRLHSVARNSDKQIDRLRWRVRMNIINSRFFFFLCLSNFCL